MSLNCKPGDLARIISHPETEQSGSVDRIIKVTSVDGDSFWSYQGPPLMCSCGCHRTMDAFHDDLLRPIRGQEGDDETLAWAGKPAQIDVMEVIPA